MSLTLISKKSHYLETVNIHCTLCFTNCTTYCSILTDFAAHCCPCVSPVLVLHTNLALLSISEKVQALSVLLIIMALAVWINLIHC